MSRYLVIPDQHLEYVDPAAYACVIEAVGIVRPDGFINLGDVGEWEGASHWQWKKKRRPPLEFQLAEVDTDIEIVNRLLDRMDEALDKANVKEKHMIEGNHDDWLNRLVEENPYLERTRHKHGRGYLFKDAIGARRRGYRFHRVGEFLKIGHLRFYHGHLVKSPTYHARTHLLKLGGNFMYGHWHDLQQASVTHVDGEKSAWSIGCLKRFDREANEWLGGAPHNWGHAFATVDFFGKDFSVNVHRIIDGKVSVWGYMIDGNKKAKSVQVAAH